MRSAPHLELRTPTGNPSAQRPRFSAVYSHRAPWGVVGGGRRYTRVSAVTEAGGRSRDTSAATGRPAAGAAMWGAAPSARVARFGGAPLLQDTAPMKRAFWWNRENGPDTPLSPDSTRRAISLPICLIFADFAAPCSWPPVQLVDAESPRSGRFGTRGVICRRAHFKIPTRDARFYD